MALCATPPDLEIERNKVNDPKRRAENHVRFVRQIKQELKNRKRNLQHIRPWYARTAGQRGLANSGKVKPLICGIHAEHSRISEMHREPKVPTVKVLATDEDRANIAKLVPCRFLPGSFDKRFARDLDSQLANSGEITEKQRAYLVKLVHKYRRQIK